MDKEDLLIIIDTWYDIERLNDILKEFDGKIDSRFPGLWNFENIILKYSKLNNYGDILRIICDKTIDTEEKYKKLF